MPPVGFEPTISAGERPQTYAVDPAATATGFSTNTKQNLRLLYSEDFFLFQHLLAGQMDTDSVCHDSPTTQDL